MQHLKRPLRRAMGLVLCVEDTGVGVGVGGRRFGLSNDGIEGLTGEDRLIGTNRWVY